MFGHDLFSSDNLHCVPGSIYGNCSNSDGKSSVTTIQYSKPNCDPKTETSSNSTVTGSCLGLSGHQYGVSYRNFCDLGVGIPVAMSSAVRDT